MRRQDNDEDENENLKIQPTSRADNPDSEPIRILQGERRNGAPDRLRDRLIEVIGTSTSCVPPEA